MRNQIRLRKLHCYFIFALITATLSACGGGSSVTPNPMPPDVSNPGTADEAVAKGLEAFRARDLVAARDAFCKELPDEPEDSHLAFGCFWAKWMLLPTQPEVSTILAVFNEDPILPELQYYGAEGIFTRISEVDRAQDDFFPQFNYSHFQLPFVDFFGADTAQAALLDAALQNGVSIQDIQGMVDDLIVPLEDLAALGVPVLADAGFSFTLPRELFNLDRDVAVTPNDAKLFVAGVEGTIFVFNFVNAYDYGVDIGKVVIGGFIRDDFLVEDLNGSGATVDGTTFDSKAFLTLVDGSRITAQKDRFLRACSLAREGLANLESGESSQWFTPARGEQSLAELVALMEDLIASTNTGWVELRFVTSQSVGLNLQQFFAHPPDAAALPLGAGDPFVLEGNDPQAVESYFRTLLDGIVSF